MPAPSKIRPRPLILLLLLSFFLVGAAPAPKPADKTICFAISAMVSPARTFSYYQDFIHYLTAKIGRKVCLKQRKTYREVNDLLSAGSVECGFICTGAFVHTDPKNEFPMIAVPVIQGKETYQSYIIVARKSPYTSIKDLEGKVFAYTDDLSNTGALYPRYLIGKMGVEDEEFFAYSFYTHSHDKSIQAVVLGIADGAAVDSLVYRFLQKRRDPIILKTRVIQRSPDFGIPPIVASPKTKPLFRQKMREVLLAMDRDPAGRKILRNLEIDRFARPRRGLYDSVIEMEKFLRNRKKGSPAHRAGK